MRGNRKFVENESYGNIEEYLQEMLPMVFPREDFVVSLRQRLMNMPAQRHWLPTVLFFIMIVMAGLVSGLILIATSLRALVTIAATLGLVYKLRSPSKGSSSPSIQLGS
jgi:hypothetical protein